MGVPKFYRWISERYPCLSEVVKEFQLPEFDNLYLDMNGIIHVCSHPDDENPHFRITEEEIFKNICHYIDFLYRMIKPRKVFFMAVDGVAPRAKMNQQRGRRFRSAREAEVLIQRATEKGEELPSEKRFDSNCITPGTPFMVRLQEHLKYFVVEKVTRDPLWQGPRIFLSGHETPGEGEHKIMDFIRYSKAQQDYDINTRHCLYGLDADLIMLGLVSHEPHFSLLREEVRFGGKRDKTKRPMTPEETTFHLLHLSLLREYLAYEFSPLKDKLPFAWDVEKIIDDWILMGFLVGNDFIPHLPHLHIHHNALPLLWKTYMTVLPNLDGYLNEGGRLKLWRFEKYFEELTKFDLETFESAFSDLKYLESKIGGKRINESTERSKMRKLKPFDPNVFEEDGERDGSEEEIDEEEESEEEEEEDYDTFNDEFILHKRNYYMSKMDFASVTDKVLEDQARGYVTAIQWILLYYYEGVPSWSWFYPFHYAPYISDVRGFSQMKINFDLSTPFLPFQQLMAVLPAASKELLPFPLQQLMTEATSPVIDFYPVNFETDLNGKQQDWEAVVLIPFIEEDRLLTAMNTKESCLSKEEKSRNRHGPHFMYQYSDESFGTYPSPMPEKFPDIAISHARRTSYDKDLFHIDANLLRKGLLPGVRLEVYFPGFPTLVHLNHTHQLKSVGVKVFQHQSRNESILLSVVKKPIQTIDEIAARLLGKSVHVGWPHLHEAKVLAVANHETKIELVEDIVTKKGKREVSSHVSNKSLNDMESTLVAREANQVKERHYDRFAIDIGNTEVVLYASRMTGRTYTFGIHGAITLEKQFATTPSPFAYQMVVEELEVEESGHTTFKTLEEVYPVGSTIFMLGKPHYSFQGKVIEIIEDNTRLRIALDVKQEPDLSKLGQMHNSVRYLPGDHASHQIGIAHHFLSRITGTLLVEKRSENGPGAKANIGLNLKFTKRGEEVPGYTRKLDKGWTYSQKCIRQVADYINRFPDMWSRLMKLKSETDVYTEDQLFPEETMTKLSDVLKYLETLPCAKVPRMKFGAEILDEDQVKRIENMIADLKPNPDTVKMKIKPKLVFRPMDNQGSLVPDPEADFHLYDRVVVVKSGYSVPFGKRGTIIGAPSVDEGIGPHSLYDVVFDEAFPGGITLRCSQGKGYRVPASAMLNTTYGEFRKGRPPSERPVVGAWNGGSHLYRDYTQGSRSKNYNNDPRNGNTRNRNSSTELGFQSNSGENRNNQGSYQYTSSQDFSKGKPTSADRSASREFTRRGAQQTYIMKQGDNREFDNIWNTLTQGKEKRGTFNLTMAASSLPKNPIEQQKQNRHSGKASSIQERTNSPRSRQRKSVDLVKHTPDSTSGQQVKQSLEASGTSDKSVENAEFLAMCNSLEGMSTSQVKPSVSQHGSSNVAKTSSSVTSMSIPGPDEALKQMLKIGQGSTKPERSTNVVPKMPPSLAQPSYGKQVSVQELFYQASKHGAKVEKMPAARNPQSELDEFCMSNYGKPPQYEFKPQTHHKQISYIANVFLPNGGRYEGSTCSSKDEAVKSAASMAMLCLKTTAVPIQPFLAAGFNVPLPGQRPQAPGAPRLLSPNSAFSPIIYSGPGQQGLLPNPSNPNQLLTPQHFINQPPPSLVPHHYRRDIEQKHVQQANQPFSEKQSQQSYSNFHQQTQKYQKSPSLQYENQQVPATTNKQPFIPLQVARNQKTPSRKTSNPTDVHEDFNDSTESENTQRKPDFTIPLVGGTNTDIATTNTRSKTTHGASSTHRGQNSSSSNLSNKPKRKSRLAANFAKK